MLTFSAVYKRLARVPGTWVVLLLFGMLSLLRGEDVLFFGDSFTYVNDVPAMVEAIAASKGKTVVTMAVTKGGMSWAYHLKQPATDAALKSKAWNWVVLQDYSLEATHATKVDDFMSNGQVFDDRIAQESPQAGIVLYETWAYGAKHPIFKGTSTAPAKFTGPDEMYGEIHQNFAALQAVLQARDPKRQVRIAPVGTAFAQCVREHPEIHLYVSDFKHPSPAGSYLAALVIYATLTGDSPQGAVDGRKVDAAADKILREVAAEVVGKK